MVGMTACLTGRYSHPGRQALQGAQAWVEDTNRNGGVRLAEGEMPLPVRLVHYDDTSNTRRCADLTKRLILGDQVDILLGPYSSGLTRTAVSVAQQHRRVLWNHGGAAESIYRLGSEGLVGILSPASTYFHGIIDMVRAAQPWARRVAIVHSAAGAFPRDVASGAEARCVECGFDAVRTHAYPAGTVDFEPVLSQLRSEEPDLILGVGRIEDDLQFARQLGRSGVPAATVGLIAAPLTLFRDALGAAAERFIGPSQWEPGAAQDPDYGPNAEQVLSSLKRRRPTGVDYPMAQAYAGCLVAQRCIEEAGSLDEASLRQVAGRLDFTTFYGRFKIDPATGRQLGHVMPVVRWEQGNRVVIWPPELSRG